MQARLTDLLEDFTDKILHLADGNELQIEADDRLLFYFAGHGIASEAQNNTDELAGYLVPQDGQWGARRTWLQMQRLHDALTQLPCRHLLIILDCCFAGTFGRVRHREVVRRSQKLYRENYERYVSGYAQQVITSTAHDEKAADSLCSFGQRDKDISGHSPFAELLLKGLDGEADYSNDGFITAMELCTYLKGELAKKTTTQTPGYIQLKGHQKGDYIFPLPHFNRAQLPTTSKPSEKTNPDDSIEEEDSHKLLAKFLFDDKLLFLTLLRQLNMLLGAEDLTKFSLNQAGSIPPSILK